LNLYVVLKVIHVAAVVMFLGNITVGILWKAIADQTQDAKIIAHTLRGIIAGIAFGPISRLQRRLLAVAQSGADAGTVDWNAYKQGSASWNVWGAIALVAPLIALVIMIAKPMLPAFPL
jgi:uncharacterized membrane protein